MPAVPTAVRRERAARLREAGRDAARRFLATHVGRTVSLLTESEDAGHSEHFAAVRLAAPVEPGRLMAARIVGVADETLLAEAA
jgi:threonylcarbamoyladenosine tRNA methylthiotransferase MtaB